MDFFFEGLGDIGVIFLLFGDKVSSVVVELAEPMMGLNFGGM